jgi:hypothetical protein
MPSHLPFKGGTVDARAFRTDDAPTATTLAPRSPADREFDRFLVEAQRGMGRIELAASDMIEPHLRHAWRLLHGEASDIDVHDPERESDERANDLEAFDRCCGDY